MEAQHQQYILDLFDFYWFEHGVFAEKSQVPKSSPSPSPIVEDPMLCRIQTLHRSFSDQIPSFKDSFSSGSISPNSVLLSPALETILSGKETGNFPENFHNPIGKLGKLRGKFGNLGFVFSEEDRNSEDETVLSRKDNGIFRENLENPIGKLGKLGNRGKRHEKLGNLGFGFSEEDRNFEHETKLSRKDNGIFRENLENPIGKLRNRRRRHGSSKSLSELEFEEVKGFMDLGFVFSEEDRNSSLVSIIPGLQRLGNGNGDVDGEEDEDAIDECEVSRPYLSEAWEVNEKPLMNWKVLQLGGIGNEMVIKDHLRVWAQTVASTVR